MIRSLAPPIASRVFVLVSMLMAARAVDVLAAPLAQEPVLRIEVGLHAGPINALAADAQGRFLATVSYDKTLRLWSPQDGRLIRVLRVPIGDDLEGSLFGVALSPDGGTAAVAGWTGGWEKGWSLYLFETGNGRLIRRIAGLPHRAVKLAFSPDGRYLATALRGENGMRAFSAKDGSLVASDTDYGNHAAHLDFAPDGRLAVTSLDGRIRLYDPEFRRTALLDARNGRSPYGVRFSPDGTILAVGYLDRPQVDVYRVGAVPAYAFSPDLRRADNGSLAHVAWSADGQTLYAGGTYERGGRAQVRAWSDGGRGSYREQPLAAKRVIHIQLLGTGHMAFATSDPSFGILDSSGLKLFEHRSPLPDYRGLADGFAVSTEGARIALGFNPLSGASHVFSVESPRLEARTPTLDAGLTPPLREAKGVDVRDWEHDLRDWGQRRTPTLNGQNLPLLENETSLSLAFAPDRKSFLLGTHYRVVHFDASGRELWSTRVPGEALAVNVSGDGRLALAALGDGTIRWFRMRDGAPLLSLFPHAEGKRWIAWTPAGYYAASADGDTLIGWHKNNGMDHEADFVPANALRDKLYRPGVIERILRTLDEGEAVRHAGIANPISIARALPPIVRILDPNDGGSVSFNPLTVRYALKGSPGQTITGLRILSDGRPLHRFIEDDAPTEAEIVRTREIVVPDRNGELSIVVETKGPSSPPSSIKLLWTGPRRDGGGAPLPNLRVLAVGVSRYKLSTLDLNYAAKDAGDFARTLRQQEGKAYGKVEISLLTDTNATLARLREELERIKASASPFDASIVFLAGHGVDDSQGRYFFLPHDADPGALNASALSYADIRSVLAALPGKVMFFIDTCRSGAALGGSVDRSVSDTTRIVNDLKSGENGVIVFASSAGHQVSHESAAWGNGAFTKAVIEGMAGSADLLKRGYATAAMLQVYVGDRVRDLTGGAQTPAISIPNLVPDFPVVRF